MCVPRQFCELTSEHASSHQNNIKDIDRAAVATRCLELFTTNRWLGRLLPRIETTMTVSVLTLPASQETGMTTMRTTNSSRTRPTTTKNRHPRPQLLPSPRAITAKTAHKPTDDGTRTRQCIIVCGCNDRAKRGS